MHRRLTALTFALLATLALAAPVAAASHFPEQPGDLPGCDAVLSLPKNIIEHLQTVNPATAERLQDNITDACFGG